MPREKIGITGRLKKHKNTRRRTKHIDVEQREETKQGFLQGVLTLMFSQVLIKLLGMVYTLYLTNREGFGDEGNGIVSSSYQIYAMLLTISSIGVPNAISKLVSERVAVGDHKGAHRIFKIAFATFALVGLIGSLLLLLEINLILIRKRSWECGILSNPVVNLRNILISSFEKDSSVVNNIVISLSS